MPVMASRGAGAQSEPVSWLVVGSIPTRGNEIFIYIYVFISSHWCRGESAALSSATQHAMPPEIGKKWGTECLNTRFPLPTLLRAGYSVKLIIKYTYLRTFSRSNQQSIMLTSLLFNNVSINRRSNLILWETKCFCLYFLEQLIEFQLLCAFGRLFKQLRDFWGLGEHHWRVHSVSTLLSCHDGVPESIFL